MTETLNNTPKTTETAAYLQQMADFEHEADFSGLQADFLAAQLSEYSSLANFCLAMLERLLLNGDSTAQSEINQIVFKEIHKRLSERGKWIFQAYHYRAKMVGHLYEEDYRNRKRDLAEDRLISANPLNECERH